MDFFPFHFKLCWVLYIKSKIAVISSFGLTHCSHQPSFSSQQHNETVITSANGYCIIISISFDCTATFSALVTSISVLHSVKVKRNE